MPARPLTEKEKQQKKLPPTPQETPPGELASSGKSKQGERGNGAQARQQRTRTRS